jgi:hypothetical protein
MSTTNTACGLSVAGVGADAMEGAGLFNPVSTGLVRLLRRAVDAATDRALEDGRIDQGGSCMGVGRRPARIRPARSSSSCRGHAEAGDRTRSPSCRRAVPGPGLRRSRARSEREPRTILGGSQCALAASHALAGAPAKRGRRWGACTRSILPCASQISRTSSRSIARTVRRASRMACDLPGARARRLA